MDVAVVPISDCSTSIRYKSLYTLSHSRWACIWWESIVITNSFCASMYCNTLINVWQESTKRMQHLLMSMWHAMASGRKDIASCTALLSVVCRVLRLCETVWFVLPSDLSLSFGFCSRRGPKWICHVGEHPHQYNIECNGERRPIRPASAHDWTVS